MNEKIKLMQTPKRTRLGGRTLTLYLTNYDEVTDTYDGHTIRDFRDSDQSGDPPFIISHRGFRPYSPSNGNKDFQFVEMGDDESPFLAIEQTNANTQLNPNLNDPSQVQDRINQVKNKNKPGTKH